MEKAEQIRTYLQDLADLRTEHLEAADLCPDGCKSGESGRCVYLSTISVESVTYQRKLDKIV